MKCLLSFFLFFGLWGQVISKEKLNHQVKKETKSEDTLIKKEKNEIKKASLNTDEQACREVNGKLECAGKKTNEKIKSEIE